MIIKCKVVFSLLAPLFRFDKNNMAAPSPQCRSKVWQFFSKQTDGIVCNKCEAAVKTRDGSTTNLHNHLKRHHGIELKLSEPKNKKSKTTTQQQQSSLSQEDGQPTLATIWTKLSTDSRRHKDISRAIAKYIVLDMRPLDSVNDIGFTQLLRTLEPRYNLQSRTHITRTLIPAMYDEIVSKVRKTLKESSFISLTTDGWTSRATKSFITVTAHVMDEKWKLKEFVLSTAEMSDSHTAENLAEHLKKVCSDWDIELKSTAITTDNAANIVLAIEKCSPLVHVRCMAHVLNLSTQKALKGTNINRLLGRVRSLSTFFHRSSVANSILLKTLKQLELPVLKPIVDVPTRWNSTYDMIDRFLKIRPAITATLSHKDLTKEARRDTLSPQDVTDIGSVRDVSTKV